RKGSGDVIESFTYTYDTRGNRTAKIFADGTAEVYGYDKLSRLVSATYPSGRVVQYQYDAVGNRTQMVEATSAGGTALCPGDRDCDGVPDAADNCPAVANANQADSDLPPIERGLAAGYNLDEPIGTFSIIDVTGRNNGTLTRSGIGHSPGKYGNGLDITAEGDGVNPAVAQVPSSPSLDSLGTELTIAAWIKP